MAELLEEAERWNDADFSTNLELMRRRRRRAKNNRIFLRQSESATAGWVGALLFESWKRTDCIVRRQFIVNTLADGTIGTTIIHRACAQQLGNDKLPPHFLYRVTYRCNVTFVASGHFLSRVLTQHDSCNRQTHTDVRVSSIQPLFSPKNVAMLQDCDQRTKASPKTREP